jgi:GTP cyclohydrolase I
MKSTTVSLFDLGLVASKLADTLANEGLHKVYGIPRGGVSAALALVANSSRIGIVDTPHEADVIVDDILDSGQTMLPLLETFNKHGAVLYVSDRGRDVVEKTPMLVYAGAQTSNWLIFPWEVSMEGSGEEIVTRLLQYIGEDPQREGLKETPKRFLKAWDTYASGYNIDPSTVLKTFEDGAEGCNEMVIVTDIDVFSHCEHHLAPFFGKAAIAYIPNKKIVGLSKLARVTEIFSRRLQVQERLTNQIADAIWNNLDPLGVGVIIQAKHMCMCARGVRHTHAGTITSALRGVMHDEPAARSEFLRLAGF